MNIGFNSIQKLILSYYYSTLKATAANYITSITPSPKSKKQLVKKHHCPKSTKGTPRTLTELKIYWEILDWKKYSILIFYQDTIAITQGFSQTFLDALTRFDATIFLITDSPHLIIPTFSTQHPHPIQSILTWLQRTLLQN